MADASALAKVLIRVGHQDGPHAAIDVPTGETRLEGGSLVVSPAPGEWLVLGPPGSSASVAAMWALSVRADTGVVVDMTHARAAVLVRGDRAADLLARVSVMDVSSMDGGTVRRTSMFGVIVDIVRLTATEPAVLLIIDRSYGSFLEALLLDMGTEFGLDAAGFGATVVKAILPGSAER